MNSSIRHLLPPALSVESIGWTVSALAHVTGVLIAWVTFSDARPVSDPQLIGQSTRVELVSVWTEPEMRKPADEIRPIDVRMLVRPDRAQVGEQTFFEIDTDVSQPSQVELAVVDRMLADLVEQPREPDESRSDLPRIDTVPAAPLSRQPIEARVPVSRVEVASVAVQNETVGTSRSRPPRLLSNLPPTYPAQALASRLEGKILLRLHITATGDIRSVEVVSSSGHLILDAAAIQAVRRWRFEPALRQGKPVATSIGLPVRFALE